MSMRGRRLALGGICAAALLLGSAEARGGPDPGAEQRRQAEREKVQGKLSKAADAAIEAVSGAVGNARVACLDLRPFLDDPAAHRDAATLQASLYQRFLAAGVLLFPCEKSRKFDVKYEYGKLPPKGPLIPDAEVPALTSQGVGWLLVGRLLPDDAGGTARLELYDLRTHKQAMRADLGSLPTKRFPMAEVCGPERIPPRNLRILEFAVENLGRAAGSGECWDLPAIPIQADGGSVQGYNFGKLIPWEEGRPGDVLTFGESGATGGHVVVVLRWEKERSRASILHQNWGGSRVVMLAANSDVEPFKPGQAPRLWRP
jgi:hypothetical protein